MRERLAKLIRQRSAFIGTFSGIGRKSGYKGYLAPTILLTNLKDEQENSLEDHVWMNFCKGFEEANLHCGDIIKFRARVEPYQKGYSEDSEENPFRIDFCLTYPRKVSKIGQEEGEFEANEIHSRKALEEIKKYNEALKQSRIDFFEKKHLADAPKEELSKTVEKMTQTRLSLFLEN